jgi:hypothetical protein
MSDNINIEDRKGFIYIVQEREFLNTNDFKLGRTSDINVRLRGYSKNSKLVFSIEVDDQYEVETMLINIFKDKFIQKIEYGREYFEGNIEEMIKEIETYLQFRNKYEKYTCLLIEKILKKKYKKNKDYNKIENTKTENTDNTEKTENTDNTEKTENNINLLIVQDTDIEIKQNNLENIKNDKNENSIDSIPEEKEEIKVKNKKLENFDYFYECKRCFYKSVIPLDIKRHLERQIKCKPHKFYITLSNEELLKQSLEKQFKNVNEIYNKYLQDLETNQKEKNKCEYCFEMFSTEQSLNRHLKICKVLKIVEDKNKIKV